MEGLMYVQLLFGISVVLGLVAWSVVIALFVWPQLQARSRIEAIRPLLVLHGFRFVGLSFLVPGVVSTDLPSAFAREVGYGDMISALLALSALAALRSRLGIALVWIFNIWGSLDLLNAFSIAYRTELAPGQLGAAFYIPTVIVPLLLITHVLVFRILLRHDQSAA
jgi:hypothetical protein